jgi:hypothetical protein
MSTAHRIPSFVAALVLSSTALGHDHGKDPAHDHDHAQGAEHDHAEESREHGAHVHGVAWLDVALDGERLEIALRGTGADLAGLEGAPADAADVAKVDAARSTLADPSRLFAFEPADACQADGAPAVEPPASALKAPPAAGTRDHDHDHAHGDWTASYVFACKTAPLAVTLPMFDRFPELTEVRAQILTPAAQTAGEATPANRRLPLAAPR